jgi:cystathionine beta-lyase family protein involved in aluminum resistance
MIDEKIISLCEKKLKKQFNLIEEIALYNQEKVLKCFQKNRIALRHFAGSSGYGYGDEGRDTLNQLFADVFRCESGICSPNIVSGTHALSLALYGVLKRGDLCLSITGEPYDTLAEVIHGKDNGSLEDYGVCFKSIELKNDKIDKSQIRKFIKKQMPTAIYMQRSRGYAWRSALSINEIENAINFVKSLGFNGVVILDNCYGEFLDKREPTEVGVNDMAGSLIKNPGGGVAPTGGYIVGDKKYVDKTIYIEVGSVNNSDVNVSYKPIIYIYPEE